MTTDQEVELANLKADPGFRYVCKDCGKTPQHIGWCEMCGYNRNYEKVYTKRQ